MLELTQFLVPVPDVPVSLANGLKHMYLLAKTRSREREPFGFRLRPETKPNRVRSKRQSNGVSDSRS